MTLPGYVLLGLLLAGFAALAIQRDRLRRQLDEVRASLPRPGPISYGQAEAIGRELHDRWATMSGKEPPLSREDMAWGDVVQFVIRTAREVGDGR